MSKNATRLLAILSILFILTFLASGITILYWTEVDPTFDATKPATHWLKIFFCYHLACWMLIGMVASYYWDLFNAGKTFADIEISQILLPILVSPIIFFSIWSQWGEQKIAFAMNLVAFQSGFFWHVVFSKAAVSGGTQKSIQDKSANQAGDKLVTGTVAG